MFPLALIIGIYSLSIFALGIVHLLYPQIVFVVTIGFIIGSVIWFRKNHQFRTHHFRFDSISVVLLALISIQWGINAIGIFIPEYSFDSLWYHLTIPKIFIEHHKIFFIEGGLYYYSLMPKLIDLLYIPPLMLGWEEGAKAIHFGFGIVTLIVTYSLARIMLSRNWSLLVLVIFSANLVVAWEAITAYIDLGRAFFEVMALYGIFLYRTQKKKLWLVESALMVGFAIAAKLLALGSLPIFVAILWMTLNGHAKEKVIATGKYIATALIVPLPFFVYAWLESGNIVYPFFTSLYPSGFSFDILSPNIFIQELWQVFVIGQDPVNPLYLMVLPLIAMVWKRLGKDEKIIVVYSCFAIVIWYFTPRTGGGRFLLPYLPVLSIMVGVILVKIRHKLILCTLLSVAIFVSLTSSVYRSLAQMPAIPYLLGKESKEQFLIKNLNFDYGDFYDRGENIKKIVQSDVVLVYGIHNLYYADFPFIHESTINAGDEFVYILAPSSYSLPKRFSHWDVVYFDTTANVVLYTKRKHIWVY